MGHLVNYEEAKGELEKALTALAVAEAKNAKARAWHWAGIAAEHAEEAGITLPYGMFGGGRRPDTEPLRAALIALKRASPEFEFYTDRGGIADALVALATQVGEIMDDISLGGDDRTHMIAMTEAGTGRLVIGTSFHGDRRTYILTMTAVEVRHEK